MWGDLMDIVIIANYTMDFSESDNGRFSYLAKLLSVDNKVEVVTSEFYHLTKRNRVYHPELNVLPFKVTFLKEPGYPRNVCLKRFWSHYIWGENVEEYIKSREKPDVIYCAVPSLTGPNRIAKYCEKNKIRFVIDIQDLWPEAFQMVVNIPIVSRIGFLPFKILANEIYKRADAICAVSNTYVNRALEVNKKCKDGTTVFLGTELKTFDRYAAENPILEKKVGEIWLAYCGTLGNSYDLTCVFDALEILADNRIRFIVMGDGPKREEFESYAKKRNIRVEFVGFLQYHQMCSLLSACDIAVNPIVHMAAQSIINKHADYAASGLPVLNTQECEEYCQLVDAYKMGFNCNNNDANDLANKLKRLVVDKKLRVQMGINARKCAEERFDRRNSYSKIINIVG